MDGINLLPTQLMPSPVNSKNGHGKVEKFKLSFAILLMANRHSLIWILVYPIATWLNGSIQSLKTT